MVPHVPFTMIGPKAGKLDGMSVKHADTLDSGKPGDALLNLKKISYEIRFLQWCIMKNLTSD